jgi:hypothetical protein
MRHTVQLTEFAYIQKKKNHLNPVHGKHQDEVAGRSMNC